MKGRIEGNGDQKCGGAGIGWEIQEEVKVT
jgi:hypothetical protein